MSGYVKPPPGGPAGGFSRVPCAARGGAWLRAAHSSHPPSAQWGAASRIPSFHPIFRRNPMPRSAATAQSPSYEQALAELERLVQAMEAGQLPLDQLLASYRRGAELLTLCRERLQAVEDQVKVLDEGQLKPWAAT